MALSMMHFCLKVILWRGVLQVVDLFMSYDEMLNMECEKYECYSVAEQQRNF